MKAAFMQAAEPCWFLLRENFPLCGKGAIALVTQLGLSRF